MIGTLHVRGSPHTAEGSDTIRFADVQAALHHNGALKNAFGHYLSKLEPPTSYIPQRVHQRSVGSPRRFGDNAAEGGKEEERNAPAASSPRDAPQRSAEEGQSERESLKRRKT